MKIAFVSFPMLGHFNPMSAVARRLARRGHEIVIFSSPQAAPLAQAAGLEFVPCGEDASLNQTIAECVDRMSRSRGDETFRHALGFLPACLEAKWRELPGLFAAHAVEAVVVDEVDMYAAVIPQRLGLPFAVLSCALHFDYSGRTPLCIYGWAHEPTPAARERNRRGAAEFGAMIRQAYDAPIAQMEAAGIEADWDDPTSLYAGRPWVTQCPREFDFDDREEPAGVRHAGPFHDGRGRPEVAFPWERLTGAPLVYASMGTLLNGDPSVFRTILDAAARLPAVQLVLSTGPYLRAEDLGPLPAGAVVVNHAPQLALLEKASLSITHAGLNTVLESLAQGVPQVAIPVSFDQPGVAARITHHQTGVVASLDGLTAGGLAESMREVLDNPVYRTNARRIQAAIRRTDGLTRAADQLEKGLGARRQTMPTAEVRAVR